MHYNIQFLARLWSPEYTDSELALTIVLPLTPPLPADPSLLVPVRLSADPSLVLLFPFCVNCVETLEWIGGAECEGQGMMEALLTLHGCTDQMAEKESSIRASVEVSLTGDNALGCRNLGSHLALIRYL